MQPQNQKKIELPKPKKFARWQDTKISALPVAEQDKTALDKFLDDDWWAKNEPPFLREQGRRFDARGGRRSSGSGRYGRDGATTATAIQAFQAEKEKAELEDSDADVESYLPAARENLREWCERLPVKLQISSEQRIAWDALRVFCARFPDTRFSELSDSAQQAIRAMVGVLCEKKEKE